LVETDFVKPTDFCFWRPLQVARLYWMYPLDKLFFSLSKGYYAFDIRQISKFSALRKRGLLFALAFYI
jgi:hypothetical protein